MVQGLKIKHFDCTMPESVQFPLPSQQLTIKSTAFSCELSFNKNQFVDSLVKILSVILFQDAKKQPNKNNKTQSPELHSKGFLFVFVSCAVSSCKV